ncbi:hypothetical protein ACU3L3_14270 [Priestia endophytica]
MKKNVSNLHKELSEEMEQLNKQIKQRKEQIKELMDSMEALKERRAHVEQNISSLETQEIEEQNKYLNQSFQDSSSLSSQAAFYLVELLQEHPNQIFGMKDLWKHLWQKGCHIQKFELVYDKMRKLDKRVVRPRRGCYILDTSIE